MSDIAPHTRKTAQRMRREMTPQERIMWYKLREINRMLGTHFRRQAPVGMFVVDFADLGRRLVIEIDGGQGGLETDGDRTGWLQSQGFKVIRFWNAEVAANIDGVMQEVLDALARCPPPPSPPHEGEGRRSSGKPGRNHPQAAP